MISSRLTDYLLQNQAKLFIDIFATVHITTVYFAMKLVRTSERSRAEPFFSMTLVFGPVSGPRCIKVRPEEDEYVGVRVDERYLTRHHR